MSGKLDLVPECCMLPLDKLPRFEAIIPAKVGQNYREAKGVIALSRAGRKITGRNRCARFGVRSLGR